MKKIIEIKKAIETLYIYWTITDFCNFRCSYCPDELHSGNFAQGRIGGFPSDSDIESFIDAIINKHLQGRFLNLCISGGEPTLHPMFKTVIERMAPHGSIEVVTNGSRDVAWWKKLPVLPDKVTISLHPEFSKLEKISEVGLFLLDNKIDLMFNLMCDPENWDWVTSVKELLDVCLHPHINAKILTDHKNKETDGKPFEYYEDQLAFIKREQSTIKNSDSRKQVYAVYEDGTSSSFSAFDLVNNKQNSFTGWACSAGSEGLRVNFDGSVRAGICSVKNLGRVKDFTPAPEAIICPKAYCKTAGDINLSKRPVTLNQGQ